MSRLFACPFCRELYAQGEAEVCPECDIVLRPLEELPPSFEARRSLAADRAGIPEAERPLPWTYVQRGRGALVLCAVLGLGLFCAPWINLLQPDVRQLSGYDLAQARGFWFAGGATGWFVVLVLAITRRTVNQMRGVRAIAAMLVSITFFQTLLLLLNPPSRSLIAVRFEWAWGIYTGAALSLLALYFAIRFGGRIEAARAELRAPPPRPDPGRETSDGHTVH